MWASRQLKFVSLGTLLLACEHFEPSLDSSDVAALTAQLDGTGENPVNQTSLPATAPSSAADVPIGPYKPYLWKPDSNSKPVPSCGSTFPGWDFEGGTLSGWTAEGSAFSAQPTFGPNVAASRVGYSAALGGDYWQGPVVINHQGSYWIGTYEARPRREFPWGSLGYDAPTGTLTSPEFELDADRITFLIGGGASGATRIELLARLDPVSKLVPKTTLTIDGQEYGVWRTASGQNSEILARRTWNVAEHRYSRARLRITDDATGSWGHINLDDIRCTDDLPAIAREDHPQPVWGLADLHSHPMAHLGFGGGLFNASPTDSMDRVTTCDGFSHRNHGYDGLWISSTQTVCTLEDAPACEPDFGRTLFGAYSSMSHGDHGWPRASTRTHQQMHRDWIRRAYDGGLRLMVASAVNAELIAALMNWDARQDDEQAVQLQVEAIKAFATLEGTWIEIAYTPAQARDIIQRNKLAVVLAVEVDLIGNHRGNPGAGCDDDTEATQCERTWRTVRDVTGRARSYHLERPSLSARSEAILDDLQQRGVRLITPVHLADNGIGGAAVFSPLFNSNNYFLNGQFYDVESGPGRGLDFAFAPVQRHVTLSTSRDAIQSVDVYSGRPGPHINTRGLTSEGRSFLESMMRRGLLIDVDHMSLQTTDNVLGLPPYQASGVVVPAFCSDLSRAECRAASYPVVSSHTTFREALPSSGEVGYEAGHRSEGDKTPEQVQRIRDLGGIVGPITKQGAMRAHDWRWLGTPACPETSLSFSQAYLYASDAMGAEGIAFGTDFNGLNQQPEGRRGRCAGTPGMLSVPYTILPAPPGALVPSHPPLVPNAISTSGALRFLDVNVDGLAHYGLIPDFLQDVRDQGLTLEEMGPLFRSAEDFIRTWERACSWRDAHAPGFSDHACR